ncbi:MAG: porphobilinogen synthase, partial [Bacteroidales bacterium]|nr:porphobilinogen synthase [Bacteroidales bacterium]
MNFPTTRLRRLRYSEVTRNMIRETQVSANDLIMPLFVCPGSKVKNPIKSMPGN